MNGGSCDITVAQVEGRIQALSTSAVELGDRLVDLLPASSPSDSKSIPNQLQLLVNHHHRMSLFCLPEDSFGLILRYLHIHETVVLTMVSKKVTELISSTQNNIWFELYNSYFPLRMDDYLLWFHNEHQPPRHGGTVQSDAPLSPSYSLQDKYPTARSILCFIRSRKINMKGNFGLECLY